MKEFVLNNWYYLLYVLVAIVYFVVSLINIIKAKKQNKNTKEIAELREKLKVDINTLIADAETLKHYTGEEKKNYVLTRALNMANNLMSKQEIDEYIEEQVKLTDCVNKNNH